MVVAVAEMEINKQDINLADYAIAVAILAMILTSIYSVIQVNRLSKVAEYNKEHVCFLTDVIYGPVPPENMEEMCDALREDLHEEWQAQ